MTQVSRTIVLVGLMGTGKSTIAKLLATRLGVECLDTDRMVEAATGRTVREIFDQSGEERFREVEAEVLAQCLRRRDHPVVAAAGGMVLREENRAALAGASTEGRATVVWLHARPEVLVARTRKGGHRPLLDADPEGTLLRLAAERAPLYRAVADVVVDVSDRDADAVVNLLMNAIDDEVNGHPDKDGHHHD